MEIKPEKKRSKFSKWMRGELDSQKFAASFGASLTELSFIRKHELTIPNPARKANPFAKDFKHNTLGLTATVKDGAQLNSYVSKAALGGGILAGAVLLGPIGAIAGGLIGSSKRKGGSEVNVLIERDGELIAVLSAPVASTPDAIKFAKCVNESAADAELNA